VSSSPGAKKRFSEADTQMSKNVALKILLNAVDQAKRLLNPIKTNGEALVGKASAIGETGWSMASTGLDAGTTLLKPGYDLAQISTELQAILALETASPEMAALQTQARQLGDSTSASAAQAASAQIIVARSGADKDGVLAQAPAVLNLSLANQASMEDNAQLLIGTKEAFGLADDKAMHIADVITTTLEKSHLSFEELSTSLTTVAPVAKSAGVSFEEAAAMVVTLNEADIRGADAGAGSRAVLERLSAPTEQAQNAIRALGVSTTDDKGNALPVMAILQALQTSFTKNNVDPARRDSDMNVIFGEENRPAATVLMTAAANGQLATQTTALKTSDGRTGQQIAVRENNLGGDLAGLQSAYESIGTDLFIQQESLLRGLVQTATNFVRALDGWIQRNQGLAQTLGAIAIAVTVVAGALGGIGLAVGPVMTGIGAIITVAGGLGTVFSVVSGAIIAAVGAITWPVVGVVAAIAAGALLIQQFWEPISAFFQGVVAGIRFAFAPLGQLFSPLAPMFNWLGEKLQAVGQWFSDLLTPVTWAESSLNSCRDAGLRLGMELASAFSAPLVAIDMLWNKATGLLEKLGLVKKESTELDKLPKSAAPLPVTPVLAAASGVPPLASSTGKAVTAISPVQPVQAPVGNSHTDNSNTNLNFYMTASPDQGQQFRQQVISVLEEHERNKAMQRNSAMRY